MEGLLERSLLIFAGKGGVGKTTTSSAAALQLAETGRRTLLVTVDPAKRLEDALGVPVGFEETPVQPNLTAMMLDPESVIREHLAREIPDAGIAEHPLFRYVTSAMPGLNELMAIGKLNDLRKQGRYDAIVVDTAPTGHALSFLSVPKAMNELMSEKSLMRWAIRGYQVWQKVQGAAAKVGKVFRKDTATPPDIDFERVFLGIQDEAQAVQDYLSDPDRAALVLVCVPEKLPVEETVDLHEAVGGLGLRVHGIVVNKMQPDTLGPLTARFDTVAGDPDARASFVAAAAKATGEPAELVEALVAAARFSEVRRAMNDAHLADLRSRLDVPIVTVPLFEQDVQGLKRLHAFRLALFDAGLNAAGRPAA